MHHIHRPISRRTALKTLGLGAAMLSLGVNSTRAGGVAPVAGTSQPFALPPLGYAYDALEPHFDARTMEIHHTRHHQAYINNANQALAAHPELQSLTAEDIVADLKAMPESIRTTLRNNVGGHLNHALFWRTLSPAGGGAPDGALAAAIAAAFGSFEQFQARFADAAMRRFGSGWAWLSLKDGALVVHSTANQDSPLMEGAMPLLGIDVWEHAYYLKYQNRRADYIGAFWRVVNWTQVSSDYAAARAG
ncbi:MAG: superoxide dismutase [Opitutaceae bacterium]|nr:superoxide dismutase [Opitutaceae bacterium]